MCTFEILVEYFVVGWNVDCLVHQFELVGVG